MSYKLSERSIGRLSGVHADLIKVACRAIEITPYDFGISEGLRTKALQAHYVKTGKSKTFKSKHLKQADGKAHAFDYYALDENGKYTVNHGYYRKINQAMVTAAIELSVPIELGGLWKSFIDAPHIQLSDDYR
jgi:peptidoglycan L-alanyl-D-glutamate endopeptidase CwlK